MNTRTYWLSFCDGDRPKGQQFLGALVVDVTDAEAEAARIEIDQRFPQHAPEAEWIAAAARKAWQHGCNPGGEIATVRIDDAEHFATMSPRYPRLHLLSRADVAAIDAAAQPEAVAAVGQRHK